MKDKLVQISGQASKIDAIIGMARSLKLSIGVVTEIDRVFESVQSCESDAVERFIQFPDSKETAEAFTTSMLAERLGALTGKVLNPRQVGGAMKALGFITQSHRFPQDKYPVKVYFVKFKI